MKYLVTGGASFIGSYFVPFFLEKNPGASLMNLDALAVKTLD